MSTDMLVQTSALFGMPLLAVAWALVQQTLLITRPFLPGVELS
jgi:hypothetical protein